MDPRFPIGKYELPAEINPALRAQAIETLAEAPAKLSASVKGLTNDQLGTPYREGGWTVRQVVHHLADSHVNAYIRLRFALTQEKPTIMPYDENIWANLPDAKSGPLEGSLALLDGLHDRWVQLFHSLAAEQFKRELVHPEHGTRTVDWLLFLYAWHCRHHTAHITELRKLKSW